MSKWPFPGARARCLLFCFQSPGPARSGAVSRGSGGAQAVAKFLCRSRRTHSNYLCRSKRPGVHTQLPIIYVRGSLPRPHIAGAFPPTYTQLPNCLCTWEPPRPHIAGPPHPPPPPPAAFVVSSVR